MSFKYKLITIALSGVLLSFMGLLPGGWYLWQQAKQGAEQELRSTMQRSMQLSLNGLYPRMEEAMQAITRNSELKKALQQGKSAGITTSVETTFRRVNAAGLIDTLEILDLNGKRLYSSQGREGKTQQRIPQLVVAENRNVRGIEMSALNELGIYVGFPIISRGQILAVGLFSRSLDPTLMGIAELNGSRLQINGSSGQLLADSAPEPLIPFQLPPLGEPFSLHIERDGIVYGLNGIPLKELSGTVIAHLIQIDDETQRFTQQQQVYWVVILSLVTLLALLALVMRSVIGRSLRPLYVAMGAFDQIAKGDLTITVEVNQSDEIGSMLHSLNQMTQHLRATVAGMLTSAANVSMAAEEISGGNDDLSGRTESLAASLEQTSASMSQQTTAVKQTADSAHTAHQHVMQAAYDAQAGEEVVAKTVSAMTEIDKASRKIAEIIGVVDGIAFQTNLLALNAAVEAARAGEHGRGFAIVAAEVRNLAQRSAGAAKDIKGLIQESLIRVEEGGRQVGQSGETLRQLQQQIQQVNKLVAEISTATAQQANGQQQINHAIASMDHVTQQNAAMVEELAASSRELSSEARTLEQLVGAFRL